MKRWFQSYKHTPQNDIPILSYKSINLYFFNIPSVFLSAGCHSVHAEVIVMHVDAKKKKRYGNVLIDLPILLKRKIHLQQKDFKNLSGCQFPRPGLAEAPSKLDNCPPLGGAAT